MQILLTLIKLRFGKETVGTAEEQRAVIVIVAVAVAAVVVVAVAAVFVVVVDVVFVVAVLIVVVFVVVIVDVDAVVVNVVGAVLVVVVFCVVVVVIVDVGGVCDDVTSRNCLTRAQSGFAFCQHDAYCQGYDESEAVAYGSLHVR